MKKITTILSALILSISIYAQAPQKISYQAVVRNASNTLISNSVVGMRISIIQGSLFGASVYVETQMPTTNNNGLVTFEIGTGTVINGSFAGINWSNGPYFIKTETDPTGGTSYNITSTSQLNSVPYALHAANVISYSAGNGIAINSNTITNTAPNQTVTISGAGSTTVTGSYPNYTINTPVVNGMPVGTILPFAGSVAPAGYLICDGSQVSRTTYANLFTTIGSAWGSGNGSTTFHLPDLRGRFLRGVDGAAGNDPDKATRTAINTGGNTGNNVGSAQLDELKSHTHTTNINSSANNGSGGWLSSGAIFSTITSNATGGSETRPKNAYVLYIIKY